MRSMVGALCPPAVAMSLWLLPENLRMAPSVVPWMLPFESTSFGLISAPAWAAVTCKSSRMSDVRMRCMPPLPSR
jgi:hypothetical protein